MERNMHETISMDDTHKFLPENNDSLKNKIEFNGLSKEEVMKCASDPKWVRLRWSLFFLFWLVWFGMIAAAISIVYVTPKCPHIPKQPWWEKEVVYQVDVAHFKDTNADAVGDLKGLMSKLNYIKGDVGAKTICLTGRVINDKSPEKLNSEYETADADLNSLLKSLKSNDMHLIVDIPYNVAVESPDSSVVRHWLNTVDGVRVTELPKPHDAQAVEKLINLAFKVEAETFEPKFIAFHPATISDFNKIKPVTLFHTINNTELKTIEDLYTNNTSVWPSVSLSGSLEKSTQGVLLLLRSTPFIEYGNEIKLVTPKEGTKLMRWDSSSNCGFTLNKTLSSQSCDHNVEEELSHGAGNTIIRMFKELENLRKFPSFQFGEIKFPKTNIENISTFVREASGFDGFLVATNTGTQQKSINFGSYFDLPVKALVVYFDSDKVNNDFTIGTEVNLERILLKNGEFLVLSFNRK